MEKVITATIKKWGINGEGIAYYKKKPVFIPNAIPGEVVNYRIEKEKSNYYAGRLVKVLEASSLRRHNLCKVSHLCGGCALMHVNYKGQCKMKEAVLKQALSKYTDLKGKIYPIVKNDSVLGYRNTCKFVVSEYKGKACMGMYASGSNHFISLDRCIVHDNKLERARQGIQECMDQYKIQAYDFKKKRGLRNVVVKIFDGQIQVIIVTGDSSLDSDFIESVYQLEGIVSIWQSIKSDASVDIFGQKNILLKGQEKLQFQFHEYTLSLLPRSFFQLNTKQAFRLYEYVESLVKPCKTLVEAYSGIGAMSILLSKKAKKIIGIEWVQDAVDNANENARNNGLDHVSFLCGDAAKKFNEIQYPVDCLVVDPPRTGLDDAMKNAIVSKKPAQIVYISCNPSTLAKDLGVLSKFYKVESIQPFDMFSQTQHVETCVSLQIRSSKNI